MNNNSTVNNLDDSEINGVVVSYIILSIFGLFVCYYIVKASFCKKNKKKLSIDQIFPDEKNLITPI